MTDVGLTSSGSTLAAVNSASDAGDRSFVDTRAHIVGVYDHDDDLVRAVVPFLADGLAAGGTAIVIATPQHRAAFAAALEARGYCVPSWNQPGVIKRSTHARCCRACCRTGTSTLVRSGVHRAR